MVVLHKEPRSRRVMAEDNEMVILHDNVIQVDVPLKISEVTRNMALVGAIEPSGNDVILAVEKLYWPSDEDDGGFD